MSTLLLSLLGLAAVLVVGLFGFGAYRAWSFRNGHRGRNGRAAAAPERSRMRYVGQTGIAVTPLRPGGVAVVEGERLEVTTEGTFIAAGSRVRVVAMGRGSYVVRLDANGR